ncbi:MAG: endolytic transglycosylase MltG [Erysipelotrichaceae bacterium]
MTLSKQTQLILGGVAAAVLIVVLALGIYVQINLKPKATTQNIIVFEVVEGDTMKAVSQRLQSEGVVRNGLLTQLYGRFKNLQDIKVGAYELDAAWDIKTILSTLNDPTAAITNEVLITFPEGIWAKEIAKKVSERTNVTSEELLALWSDPTFLNEMMETYDFITDEIFYEDAKVDLEGYFFPESYFFYRETSARDVTMTLLNQSQKVYDELQDLIASSGMTYHEILTLASIVQFESATADQMKMIAGIFFNRLNDGMMLQSSVTVCYALYEYDSWKDCETDVTIDSPYNTYLYTGLPPGPILNPGKEAIQAVLQPEKSNNYYFIADVCGDGSVYYAETFAEHQANVDKYLTCY